MKQNKQDIYTHMYLKRGTHIFYNNKESQEQQNIP